MIGAFSREPLRQSSWDKHAWVKCDKQKLFSVFERWADSRFVPHDRKERLNFGLRWRVVPLRSKVISAVRTFYCTIKQVTVLFLDQWGVKHSFPSDHAVPVFLYSSLDDLLVFMRWNALNWCTNDTFISDANVGESGQSPDLSVSLEPQTNASCFCLSDGSR